MKQKISYETKWKIRKFRDDAHYRAWLAKQQKPDEVSEFDGNVLLNEGITALLNLLTGETEDAYSNANAYIGVGDDDTAAAAAQTGLQAVSNKTYKAMETSYPSISNQTVTFRSVFGSSDANYAWKEFTVINASTDTGDNLNRKVSDQGTKASGQTWTVDVEITFS